MDVREGQILAEKYRIERVLGAGAMGVVVAAYHLGLDTKVAIKFLMPEMLGNEEALARFAREARAAAKITNEHVTRVLDVGTLETGAPYMVMEFLDGVDLRVWLGRTGQLPVAQAVDFVIQACEAIGEAHDLGIIHRDLKPSNLFCLRRANGAICIKVLDFGISKINASGSAPSMAMTRTSATMGSPLYMSPEQMESARDVDARSDIWAIGVTLFELLTGQTPFTGDTLPEICLKVTTRAPPPIRTLRGDVPVEIEAAILKCLEKDRNNRYANVGELCAVLAPFGEGHRPASRVDRMRRTQTAPTFSETLAAPDSLEDSGEMRPRFLTESVRGVGLTGAGFGHRRGRTAVAIAGATTVLSALGLFLFLRSRQPDAATPSAGSPVSTTGLPPSPAASSRSAAPFASSRALADVPAPGESNSGANTTPSDTTTAPSAEPALVPHRPAKLPQRPNAATFATPAKAPQSKVTPQTAPPAPPEAADQNKSQSAYDERL